MVDPETVRSRLERLDAVLRAAARVASRGREAFLASEDLQTIAERHLQVAALMPRVEPLL